MSKSEWRNNYIFPAIEKPSNLNRIQKFDDLVFYKKSKENIPLWNKVPLLKNYMIAIVYADFLFDDRNESFFEFATFLSSHRKGLLYESSFEIYTKLYNFYSSNGDSLQAKHAHYRANESYRKLLLAKGGFKRERRKSPFGSTNGRN